MPVGFVAVGVRAVHVRGRGRDLIFQIRPQLDRGCDVGSRLFLIYRDQDR